MMNEKAKEHKKKNRKHASEEVRRIKETGKYQMEENEYRTFDKRLQRIERNGKDDEQHNEKQQ